jgi:hypothetical protein
VIPIYHKTSFHRPIVDLIRLKDEGTQEGYGMSFFPLTGILRGCRQQDEVGYGVAAMEYVSMSGIRVWLLISRSSRLHVSTITIISSSTSIHYRYTTALPREVAALQSQIQLGLV